MNNHKMNCVQAYNTVTNDVTMCFALKTYFVNFFASQNKFSIMNGEVLFNNSSDAAREINNGQMLRYGLIFGKA